MNVIGDIAGQYETLLALLKKMPDDVPVSLGDMIDRGPDSKKVLDFFMSNGRAIFGNHEHLMVDALTTESYYDKGLWLNYNGGGRTVQSFGFIDGLADIPEKYVEWLESLPLFIEHNGYLLTHAPVNPSVDWEMFLDYGKSAMDTRCGTSVLWNRGNPRRIKNKVQLHGHEAHKNVMEFRDQEGIFAYGIDTSRAKKLTGYSTITNKTYEQEYI